MNRAMQPQLRVLAVLTLAACGSDEPSTEIEEQPSEISPTCKPPPDCLPITSLIDVGVCCSDTLRCGLDVSPIVASAPMYPELAALFEIDPAKPCWPRAKLFIQWPTREPSRVDVEDGDDVLITPRCQGRLVTSTPMPGCCRPDDTCGYDTHLVRNTFNALTGGASVPGFSQPECLRANELNARLRDHELEAFAYVPEATGSCEYARLAAELR